MVHSTHAVSKFHTTLSYVGPNGKISSMCGGATRKSAKPQKDLKSRILEIAREGETRDKARASCRHDACKLRTACRDLRTEARKNAHGDDDDDDDDDDDCKGTAADGRR